jgi:hypothetical protein
MQHKREREKEMKESKDSERLFLAVLVYNNRKGQQSFSVFAGHTVRSKSYLASSFKIIIHGGSLYMILHSICNKGRLFVGVFLPI